MNKIGKRVVDDLYVHLSALDHLQDLEQRRRIESALTQLPASAALTVRAVLTPIALNKATSLVKRQVHSSRLGTSG